MLINGRLYQSQIPFKLDNFSSSSAQYLFQLEYLSALELSGNDPIQYLQGQLTCDVSKVTKDFSQPAALCNIKGRILALLNTIFWEEYYLILPKDLAIKTQKTLNKTAMFSKVAIQPKNDLVFFGIYMQQPTLNIQNKINLPENLYEVCSDDKICSLKISENLYIVITKQKYANDLVNCFSSEQILDELTWHTLCIQEKLPEIYPQSSGQFLPHRLNLHKTPCISFDKGCFVGQEIIARTHYRAKLKHGVYVYQIETNASLNAGLKMLSVSDMKEIGELVDYSVIDTNKYLIFASLIFEHDNKFKFFENDEVISFNTWPSI